MSAGAILNQSPGGGSVPSGLICMWSGAADAIPEGWLLCNGNNNTPDLRNRFIVGAGSTYSVGNTGGSNNVTLTANQLPRHTHRFRFFFFSGPISANDIILTPAGSGGDLDNNPDKQVRKYDWMPVEPDINSTQSQSHENRPPLLRSMLYYERVKYKYFYLIYSAFTKKGVE